MKVVQILPSLNEGGVERGVVDLNREFSKLGIKNIVISKGGKLVSQIKKDGGEHIIFDVYSKNILTFYIRMKKLRKILKKIDPDIIHVRSRVPAWLVYYANKTLKIKIVSTVHGFNSVNMYSKIMTKADRVICGSSFMIEHIIKHYNTKKDKINLIPRGIDEDYFNDKELDKVYLEEIKSKYDLHDKIIFTQVARITYWKDQETVIRAMSFLKKELKNFKLLLIGSYSLEREGYYNKLQALVKELELTDCVVFLGHSDKIKELLSISNLNISASYKPETFGRANVEGMFLGVPLVGSNIGATSDYILEGETGYFFPPKDPQELTKKIILAMNTYFVRDNIIKFSKSKFTLTKMVEKNINVYKGLLS